MRLPALALAALVALAACAAPPEVTSRRSDPTAGALPAMKTFRPRHQRAAVARSNIDLARDFLDLTFELESGRPIPQLTRFEGPITVALRNADAAPTLSHDLDALLARLRNEAGIDIARAADPARASISVWLVPRRELQGAVPQAACFVVPRVTSWAEFRANRSTGALDWTTLARRERAAVFIPAEAPPQEMRDCLHEEIAQALGPVNDLYRLGDSVFNDDNMHSVLTPFDMLMLRVTYAPELANGMSRRQVAAALPGILARLNPAGRHIPSAGDPGDDRDWKAAIDAAFSRGTAPGRRLALARRAVQIATDRGWRDNRMAYSLFALGRLSLGVEARTAAESFARAYALYAKLFGVDDIHAAHVALQLSAFALSAGEAQTAIRFVDSAIPAALRAENAALLSSLLMVKAEALALAGRMAEAQTVRLDSLAWGRYGFGSDARLRRRAAEIAALAPKRARTGS